MKYVDAFEKVDLEYIVKPDGIKENIILKSADAQNEFVVNYDVGKLVAVQKDSRTIDLVDGETVKYTISAPVMMDAGAQNIVARYNYDAWGKIVSVTNVNGVEITDTTHIALINPFCYRGYYYDSETGLYYVSSRYYDPEIGRWINADTQLNTSLGILGLNQFSYCLNNPINMVDYGGNKPGDLFDTMDEAARDAAIYLGNLSFKNCWEYGSNIYSIKAPEIDFKISFLKFLCIRIPYLKISIEIKNKYSYTEPHTKEDPWSVSYDKKMKDFRVATLHTHPMGSGRGITRFSQKDKVNAKKRGAYSYVYGPNGQVRKYDPWSEEDVLIFEDLPVSINKPWLE